MPHLVLGIDEVGRGPIAGPLVIGACILPVGDPADPDFAWQNDLADSKQLTEKRRQVLSEVIRERALAYGLGWVPAEELDRLRLPRGLKTAAARAVDDLFAHFPDAKYDEIIIDGNTNFLESTPYADRVTTLIKADQRIKAVSAASIIAKVARDRYMSDVAATAYPDYQFERHKGYGTKLHWQLLDEFGPCPEHRRLIARIANQYGTGTPGGDVSSPTTVGRAAEDAVSDYLSSLGHKILSRNYRRKHCEIDIVSATSDHIYFTEVKYRAQGARGTHGTPVDAITEAKRRHMLLGVKTFLQDLTGRRGCAVDELPSPVLAVGTMDADGELDWFTLGAGDS